MVTELNEEMCVVLVSTTSQSHLVPLGHFCFIDVFDGDWPFVLQAMSGVNYAKATLSKLFVGSVLVVE